MYVVTISLDVFPGKIKINTSLFVLIWTLSNNFICLRCSLVSNPQSTHYRRQCVTFLGAYNALTIHHNFLIHAIKIDFKNTFTNYVIVPISLNGISIEYWTRKEIFPNFFQTGEIEFLTFGLEPKKWNL